MDGVTPGTRRTYWHLESLARKPNDYDIGTSRLLWYVERGLEVRCPVEQWHARHRPEPPLQGVRWERFRDPRETTYTKYVEIQAAKETFVQGLLRSIAGGEGGDGGDGSAYDHDLAATWVRLLDRVLAPLRFPVHGLEMAAAYLGQTAPSGRIVVTALLQAADEIRRIQWLAYRTRQLQHARPGFAADARTTWENDPVWQPLRELVERLLVTYEWEEAFAALNLVVKPALDELFTTQLGRVALRWGDPILEKMLFSFGEDSAWQRAWTGALVSLLIEERPEIRAAFLEWTRRWSPRCATAVAPFAAVLDEAAGAPMQVAAAVEASGRSWRASLGIA